MHLAVGDGTFLQALFFKNIKDFDFSVVYCICEIIDVCFLT